MARIKISELPELDVATLDTTYIAGVYDNTTFKIPINRLTSSLDTTFASDLVVNAVSGTINTLATTASLNTLSTSIDSRLDGLESFSSSADNRYVLSGSITQTTWDNIANKPNDIISSSTQISNLGFVTGSYTTITSFNNLTQSFNQISQSFTTISGSFGSIDFSGINTITASYLEFTQSYYSASASFDSRIDGLENATSSYLTSLNGAISSSSQLTSSYDTRYTLSGSVPNIPTGSFATTGSNTFIGEQIISSSLIVTNEIKGIGNIFLQPDVNDARYFQIYNTAAPSGNDIHFKGNTDFNYFGDDTNYLKIDDSAQTITITGVNGVFVSSSLNVTDSINGTINATNGVISGSSQLTSSYDARYALSSSFSSISSSFNSRFNGLVTTGSNTFSGSQIFSGSMVVTSGQIIASAITNNSSSLFLQSGSNLYVQNNGLVEITGSLNATSITGSIAATNGVISGSTQLTTAFPSKTTGAWSVPAGASTQSFTVEAGASYTMWVNGNIPNGIITWNATVTTSNTNVPVVGSQYGWYYTAGNALVLTAMPDQIIGTTNTLISSPASYAPNTSNVFKFGITNNSGTTQTINYGYIKLS